MQQKYVPKPRAKVECLCDAIYARNKASHKRGLYYVLKTSDELVLVCFTCKREQRFGILTGKEKEKE